MPKPGSIVDFMQGISFKAIALATLAVFGIDIVSGTLLAAIYLPTPLDRPAAEALAALNADGTYLAAALLMGTASTAVGGYLTARIAGQLPYFNALAYGVLGLAIGIPMTQGLPAGFRVIGLGLTIPAALLGAHFSKLQGR